MIIEPLAGALGAEPAVEATDSFCESSTETSRVAVFGLAGFSLVGSALRSTPRTRAFWTMT